MILDGWCMPILFGEALTSTRPPAAGATPRCRTAGPYRDYIAWLGRQDLEAAESYWRASLDGVRAADPAGDRPPGRPAGDGPPPPRGERIVRLPADDDRRPPADGPRPAA